MESRMNSNITACLKTAISAKVHATGVETEAVGTAVGGEEGVEIEIVEHIRAAHLEIETHTAKLSVC